MKKTLYTGRDFGIAVAEHFGLDPNRVQAGFVVKTDINDVFSITLTLKLTGDDLRSIGALMESSGLVGSVEK